MPKKQYSFDSKCFELAEHFLPTGASMRLRNELAQAIQDEVEDWCETESNAIQAEVIARTVSG